MGWYNVVLQIGIYSALSGSRIVFPLFEHSECVQLGSVFFESLA